MHLLMEEAIQGTVMERESDKLAWRNVLAKFENRKDLEPNAQNVHTPFELCKEIIGKLDTFTCIFEKDFLVLNISFIEVLIYDFGIGRDRIYFVTDCDKKAAIVKKYSRYKGVHVEVVEYSKEGLKNMKPFKGKKFDVVVGNPPYQAPKKIDGPKKGTIGGSLWPKFVELSFELSTESGFVCLVHPPGWRKPEHRIFDIVKDRKVYYLEMHGEQDGKNTFGASTSYDWYVAQNTTPDGETEVIDEHENAHHIDISKVTFIPSSSLDLIRSITAEPGDETCEVLFSRSAYGSDKSHMAPERTGKFKHPCVHSMRESGELICWFSSKKDMFFGTPKVILNFGRYLYPYVDVAGDYGLTQIAFGLKIDSEQEGENIKRAIESDKFKAIVKATKWSSFQTDWRMFKYFKKDFWKAFV